MTPNGPVMPMKPQAAQMPPGETPDEAESDESHPAFVAAMEFAMKALYEKKAAIDVAEALKLSQDPAEALANAAYEMTSIADEKTQGQVPGDLLVLLASRILEEVATIAEAAGVELKGGVIAQALKQMILRYMGEQGLDTSQLQTAMDAVDPAEFDRMGEQA